MLTRMSRTDSKPGSSPRVSTGLVIETPENVVLTSRLAGPAARLLAYMLDFLLRAALLFVTYRLVGLGLTAGFGGISLGVFLLLVFFVDWAYYGVSEGFFR